MRYYLIAGERSGDLHGGNLLRALKERDPALVARGFGGQSMKDAGMDLTVHYERLAFMGFNAVIANWRTISSLLAGCKKDISDFRPDVVILIDYSGFNLRIAKFAKARGFKVFYYISPKVWAWNTSRARKLKARVDRLFCILPFEKDFFKKFDWDVDYVGNPIMDAIRGFRPNPAFLDLHGLDAAKRIVALLPGSRQVELKRMIPVMAEVARRNPDYQFAVAAIKDLPLSLYQPLAAVRGVRLIFESPYDLLSNAHAAIVTSGTAALETCLFRVPQVVIYRAGLVEYPLLRALIKVNYISLVNLIANRPVIRELIQFEMTAVNINAELGMLMRDSLYREKMLKAYEKIHAMLNTGSASANAANLMVGYLRNEK